MVVRIDWKGREMQADLSDPIHLAIPLDSDLARQPNAFGAPPYSAEPFRSGDFIGSIEHGSPVNFFNIRINPHGNGTHTETISHIHPDRHPVHEVMSRSHYIAAVVTVMPTRMDDGDLVITPIAFDGLETDGVDALIVRTLPNNPEKKYKNYFGTNPPYFAVEAMQWIHEQGFMHLLTDLPSVDREEDGGKVLSHKTFWQLHKNMRSDRTITEMIFVANDVEDGLYLLDIQIAPTMIDVSPSRPVIYKLT